jgi:hypothetical protein
MSSKDRDPDQPGLWPAPDSTARRSVDATLAQTSRRISAPRRDIAGLWHIQDIAAYFDVSVDTVYGWRSKGYGPPAIKIGKHLRWRPEVVVAWVKEQERPTG